MSEEIETFEPSSDGTCDHSGEELLHDCCRELGVNMAMALQIYAWADEKFSERRPARAGLEELRQLNARFREALHILIAYQANQKTLADVQLSTRVMAYVLGFKTAAGAETITDLARQFGIKKQTPNKCKMNFRAKLGMAADDGEREDDACKKMAAARKKQLTQK